MKSPTADRAEFFRVIRWCYEVAGIGHHVRANVQDRHRELRLTFPKIAPRLERLAALIVDDPNWRVIKDD